jgi:hypothetical protein
VVEYYIACSNVEHRNVLHRSVLEYYIGLDCTKLHCIVLQLIVE